MSHAIVSAALATVLDTLDVPTAFENADFVPPAGVPYLSESLLPSGTVPLGVSSSSSDLFEGIYQVLAHAPAGAGKGAAFALAQQVLDLFPRGLRTTFSGSTVTIRRAEQNAAFKSGDRFVVPVSIYYRLAA